MLAKFQDNPYGELSKKIKSSAKCTNRKKYLNSLNNLKTNHNIEVCPPKYENNKRVAQKGFNN